jgi:two-component system heavy metal sensor histidine kinase CusS
MRSIRLSLVVYFLVLLGMAFLFAFWQIFQTARETLRAKEETDHKLVQAQYEKECKEKRDDADEQLRLKAQALARLVRFDWDPPNYRELTVLGLLAAVPSPNGHVLAPTWIAQGWGTFFNIEHYQRAFAAIRLDRDDALGPIAEYFQINTSWGAVYRSDSLGRHSFPDPRNFFPNHVLHWKFFDAELPGVKLRRVVLKVPAARLVPFWANLQGWKPPRTPNALPDEPLPHPLAKDGTPPRPSLFIQCAMDMAPRDKALLSVEQERDQLMAKSTQDTATSLRDLRRRLLLVGSLTFAGAVLGSLWLVGLGLSPLRRLSEAVHRISPRDIRLPWVQTWLPLELQPIVQRLTETLELLQRAFAREKQATADISHELRTPLAALLATTELALRKPRSPEQYAEMMASCRASVQQMNRIIERLLTLARLDAGVDSLSPRTVDAAVVAAECARVVRPLAEARGLTLTLQAPDDQTTELLTDPDKLREVLNNLLHNAIQYNQPGGRVDLTVSRSNGQVEVEVRDTGMGIAPEQRGHIFERFYRADPSRQSDGLNAGLGLAIVKEYVELMGGTIAVDSTVGAGSTFRILLPATEPSAVPQRLPA